MPYERHVYLLKRKRSMKSQLELVFKDCFFSRRNVNTVKSINTNILMLRLFIKTRQKTQERDAGILMATDILESCFEVGGSTQLQSAHAQYRVLRVQSLTK